jgi:hypothetical protein
VKAGNETRGDLLVATAVAIGRRWFAQQRVQTIGEGRVLAGGWPGTVREARVLVAAFLAPVLAHYRMPPPTHEEVGWVIYTAYDEARNAWLTSIDERGDRKV